MVSKRRLCDGISKKDEKEKNSKGKDPLKPIKIEFGERLKEKRKEKNYKTQEIFAKALSTSEKEIKLESVRNWEQGNTFPEIGTLIHISNLLDCDVDYLLGRLNEETPTHASKYIHEKTKLSTTAIEKLLSWSSGTECDGLNTEKWISFISAMIEDPATIDLLKKIHTSIINELELQSMLNSSTGTIIPAYRLAEIENSHDATMYALSRISANILENTLLAGKQSIISDT